MTAWLRSHPGLQILRQNWRGEIDWPWLLPVIVGQPLELESMSELRRLGYEITGSTRRERWQVLMTAAVPLLGHVAVTQTIEGHIRLRAAQHRGESRYAHALSEWRYDLGELRRTHAGF
jgi:hypothetical protein